MRPACVTLCVLAACTGPTTDSTPAPACEGTYEAFEPGMSFRTTQGNFYIELTEATPDPPDEGVNDWVVTLTTESGSTVNGGVVSLTPYMPAHDHGLNPEHYRGVNTEGDGEYVIPTFDLIMPGVWEFRFLVTESMMNDTASISFCVEG